MAGWVDEGMDGWMDGWRNGWSMDARMYVRTEFTNMYVHKRPHSHHSTVAAPRQRPAVALHNFHDTF